MSYYDRNQARNRRFQKPVEEKSQRPSVLGAFFNPNFGMSLSALKETGRMFVHLIALLFAQADLIDKRHPIVIGKNDQKFSLMDVVNLAYQRVEWRRDKAIQCALFSAVIACIALCGISIVYALFAIVFSAA